MGLAEMIDLQKHNPIRSKKLRSAARGQPCTGNFPGICNYDIETVVLAHLHDETFGMGMKADDTSAIHLCSDCHRAYDLHQTGLDDTTLNRMIIRALQRTIRNLTMRKVIIVPLDTPRAVDAKKRKSGKKMAAPFKGIKAPKKKISGRGFAPTPTNSRDIRDDVR